MEYLRRFVEGAFVVLTSASVGMAVGQYIEPLGFHGWYTGGLTVIAGAAAAGIAALLVPILNKRHPSAVPMGFFFWILIQVGFANREVRRILSPSRP